LVALDVVVVVAVALLGFLVAGLLRSNAELTRSMHQMGFDLGPSGPGGPGGPGPHGRGAAGGVTTAVPLHAGSSAGGTSSRRPTPARPDVADIASLAGLTPSGDSVSLAVGDVGHDTLVAFLTSGCQTCRTMWDSFRGDVTDVPGGARLVVVTRGSEAESPGAVAELAGPRLPVVMSTSSWEHYDVPYAPYFIYVSGPAGRITGEGVASTWEQVKTLLANAVADRVTSPAAPPGVIEVDRSWARAGADAEREARIDRDLSAAGIGPGDPRLYPTPVHPVAGGEASTTPASVTPGVAPPAPEGLRS